MQTYISINSTSKDTDKEIHLKNKDNEICGKLLTTDKDNTLKDIKQIFLRKDVLSNLDGINTNSAFDITELAQKLNTLISLLKN